MYQFCKVLGLVLIIIKTGFFFFFQYINDSFEGDEMFGGNFVNFFQDPRISFNKWLLPFPIRNGPLQPSHVSYIR